MEENTQRQRLEMQEDSEAITFCPSFNSYSSDKFAEIADKVTKECIRDDDDERHVSNELDDDDDDDDFGRKRRGRRRRRQWWSEYSPAEMDQEPGILEEFIDSIWIFKVFGSYGWLLPAIVISLLLTTGPKAFLMALALPIGQSTLTLAFKKLKGITQNNPKRKTKTKKSQRANTVSDVELEEEDEEESGGTRKVARGYQSWLSRDDASTFGGWDELDRLKEFDMGSSRRSARTGRSGRTRTEKGKFSGRVRKSDMPLLLRLLIAVFPFLGSWTRML
ncbi:uncharacterized protein LOC114258541 [Camellia sinensis]|uniref:uncharacterized protein LOC114258541 n=1 Tax=Camellia sinensis TaxID=4442 RepID=UPI001035807F|nr:uncharacterized protein LOC114258541 [Camellia sinensis]